ncbi:type II toxin-antitoxin system RelE/ParE family toxin [Pedobacter cryotolerans]|uniref:Type II toxin-antitoxin system RelE/ParE family toxin n=1 Tax=Pedobacter cryotolerans TaxID=2571270 RepID=A0A4U1C7N8_9SPHI|nr:type II toxin-antitoxin system RelE/ParE family toxin [Pedobacter cryotolerans]TKC02332.1 hypothetical protein FA045_03355 [Pedobacter cryotolerans]
MGYNLHYFDEVKFEIQEAKNWYKGKKIGLEKRFAQEVKRALVRVQNNPKGYEIKYKKIRSAFTDVFPYAIHFFIDDEYKRIVIVAILHQNRNPKLHQNR